MKRSFLFRRFPLSFAMRFLLVAIGAAAFSILFNTFHTAITETVSNHWRGGYDLLIRGNDSQSATEKSNGLMDGNFLGEATYGITLDQLRLIQSLDGVEIAAPLAPIGYALNDTQGIVFQLADPEPDTIYRFSYRISGDQNQLIAENDVICLDSDGPVGIDCLGADSLIGGGQEPFLILTGYLPVGWKLIAGIDPVQEDLLTGLSVSVPRSRGNRYLSENEKLLNVRSHTALKSLEIPLIVNQTAYVDQTLTWSASARETPIERFVENGAVDWDAVEEIFADSDAAPSASYSVDLADNITALNTRNVFLDPDGNVSFSANGFSFYSDTQLLLLPDPFEYEADAGGSVFRVHPVGSWGADVVPYLHELKLNPNYQDQPCDLPPETLLYRKLAVVRPSGFRLNVIGTYDFEKLNSYADPLTYVPLGIYQPPRARGEDGTEVRPDLNPAGFIPQPAFGLTNLTAAKYLIGREDFISSIRVRVGGIDSYTPENVARIQRVASQVRSLTGLRVDVVAGSSPREVRVEVPDAGAVWENWTTLGEAARITSGFNRINAVFFFLFALTAVSFQMTMARLEVQNSRILVGVLKSVGWRRRDIISALLRAQIAPFLIGVTVATLFGLIFSARQGVRFNPVGSLLILFAFGVILFLSAYLAIRKAAVRPPAADFAVGSGVEDPAADRSARFGDSPSKNVFRLALSQILRRPRRIALSILALALSVFCAVFTGFAILSYHRQLTVSLLGARIGIEIGDAHLLIVLAMSLMSALIVYAVLWMNVSERADEYALFRAFGWRRRTILSEILIEGGAAGAAGGVIGSVAGFAAFIFLTGSALKVSMLLTALAAAAAAIAASLCVAGVIANRMIFRTSANRSAERSIHVQFPWMVPPRRNGIVLSLLAAVFAIGFSFFLSSSDAPLNERIPWVREEIHRRAVTDENISGYRILNHLNALTRLGERNGGNEAEASAADYIQAALERLGFDVSRDAVPTNTLQVQVGNRIVELWTTGSFVHESRLKPGGSIIGEAVFLTEDDDFPAKETLKGKIILFGVELNSGSTFETFTKRFFEEYGPEDLKAVFFFELSPPLRQVLAQNSTDLFAEMRLGTNISAALAGEDASAPGVMLYAHYDSNPGSPGANSGTGAAVLLDVARRLAERRTDRSVRLVFLTSTERKFALGVPFGPEGMIRYVKKHDAELRAYGTIVSVDHLGVWKKLLIGSAAEPADLAVKEDFYSFYFERELSYQDLDALRILKKEAPPLTADLETVERFVSIGEGRGIDVTPASGYGACLTDGFHAAGIPAIGFCGDGDELADTALDDMANIQVEQLYQAAAILYDALFGQGATNEK